MGIDYGTKRIGIAFSDDNGSVAFPSEVISNKDNLNKIIELAIDNKVERIVIGESQDLNMNDNPLMIEINNLKQELEVKGFEVELHSEFLTSHQISNETFGASRKEKSRKPNQKDEMLDAKSATLMLQSYLDLKGNN